MRAGSHPETELVEFRLRAGSADASFIAMCDLMKSPPQLYPRPTRPAVRKVSFACVDGQQRQGSAWHSSQHLFSEIWA